MGHITEAAQLKFNVMQEERRREKAEARRQGAEEFRARAIETLEKLGQNTLHNATVHYHNGNEAESEECEVQACAMAEAWATIAALPLEEPANNPAPE